MKRILRLLVADPVRELLHPPVGQVGALDALRTSAVVFVILTHCSAAFLAAGGARNVLSDLPFVKSGWVGVDLFFVLSGYLIGRQLWRELQRTNTIRLKAFLLRRGLRIWPLYFLTLAFVMVVLGHGEFPLGKWWSDVLFITNYVNRGVVMGSWSLCTEEQFYLLAPLVVLLAARRLPALRDHRAYLWALLLLLPAGRALRWWTLTGGLFRHDPAAYRVIYYPIQYHADALVVGLLLANYAVAGFGRSRRGFFASAWSPALALGVLLLLDRVQHEILNFTGVALFFGALTWFLLSRPGLWASFLGSRPFYVVSRLSFGMYLNHEYVHEPVTARALKMLPSDPLFPALPLLVASVVVIALSVVLSAVTFCLIEHPFLALRALLLRSHGPQQTPVADGARTDGAAGPPARLAPVLQLAAQN